LRMIRWEPRGVGVLTPYRGRSNRRMLMILQALTHDPCPTKAVRA
jgi:hypothetical protein